MLPVTGTITQDGQLALAVLGPPGHPDIPVVAALVAEFTPKITAYPQELHCALSWAVVVQCAFTFGAAWTPSPELSAWIDAEAAKRMVPQPLEYPMPRDDLKPYAHQLTGAAMIKSGLPILFTDEPGTGKTITAILGLSELLVSSILRSTPTPEPILVIAPASVVDPWVQAIRLWAPHWRVAAYRGPRRGNLLGGFDVYVCSYDVARIDAPTGRRGPLNRLAPQSVVIDECFPAGTLISTPTGPRPIESLRSGDLVIGVDHTTGESIVTAVQHRIQKEAPDNLVSVQGVEMTPNHPVWTKRGYRPAATVHELDTVCTIGLKQQHGETHADVRMVQADVHSDSQPQQGSQVLRAEVFCQVADVQAGVRRLAEHPQTAGRRTAEHAQRESAAGGAGQVAGAPVRPGQPAEGPGGAGACSCHAAGAGLPDAHWGEWPADSASEIADGAAGLARGTRSAHQAQATVPHQLQAGLGRASVADRGGAGRGKPQDQVSAAEGSAQRLVAEGNGLAGSAVPQQEGAGRHGHSGGGDPGRRTVYNIETGTGNYVAGGLLVHNCHMIKDPGTKRSQAVVRIARDAPFVIGMSGTPITHHTGNLTPMLEAMDHWAWPSGDRFKERYLLTEKEEYGVKVIGLAPHTEPEFRATLEGQMRRVAKEDVLDLPPKIYSVRTVDLPAAYRKAYDEFEQDMITQLPDGDELAVMHTFTVMTHLKSLACAPADVRYVDHEVEDKDPFSPTFGELINKRSVHLDLKAPSWKVAVMLEILEERPDQPVLVFAPSKQLIMLAGEAAAKAGRRVGYIVGGQSAKQRTAVVDGFQSGVYDVVCVTTQAGGVGITLTAAKTLVFLQRPVSSVDATQAEDRAHRIGQVNEHVEIIDIIATDTIDTRIREILKNNAGQLSELVKDPRIRAQLLGGLRADGRAA